MKGKLYLGKISDFENFSKEGVKCFAITRSDRFHKYMDVLISLAPSWDLLKWHNANKDRENFREGYYDRYFNQIKNSKEAKSDIKRVLNLLDNGINVAFICFCGSYDRCHRGLLGNWIEKKGYTVVYK